MKPLRRHSTDAAGETETKGIPPFSHVEVPGLGTPRHPTFSTTTGPHGILKQAPRNLSVFALLDVTGFPLPPSLHSFISQATWSYLINLTAVQLNSRIPAFVSSLTLLHLPFVLMIDAAKIVGHP